MPRLENWSVTAASNNPFLDPVCQSKRLHGNVYDNPNFNDGDSINTSVLKEFDYKNRLAKTRNTEYKLGEIDKDYEKYLEENNIVLEGY